jgi:hypothetical protein
MLSVIRLALRIMDGTITNWSKFCQILRAKNNQDVCLELEKETLQKISKILMQACH